MLLLEEAGSRRIRARRQRLPRPSLQAPQLPDFVEGRLYELYELHADSFPKLNKRASGKTRDRVGLKLVRGPCLYIILALRMLVEGMDDYLECLDNELKAPDLKFEDIAKAHKSIQQRKEKIR